MIIYWLTASFIFQHVLSFATVSHRYLFANVHQHPGKSYIDTEKIYIKSYYHHVKRTVPSTAIGSSMALKMNRNTNDFQKEVTEDATSALASVGWSAPMMETELTSDDPFVQRINAQILAENGVGLDGLLNPAKVRKLLLNTTRFVMNQESQLHVLV